MSFDFPFLFFTISSKQLDPKTPRLTDGEIEEEIKTEEDIKTCWNVNSYSFLVFHLCFFKKISLNPKYLQCGSPGHEKPQCPMPYNAKMIRENSALFHGKEITFPERRYHEFAAISQNAEPGIYSKNLRKALGMSRHQVFPPFYDRVILHGKPPSYPDFQICVKDKYLERKESEEKQIMKETSQIRMIFKLMKDRCTFFEF